MRRLHACLVCNLASYMETDMKLWQYWWRLVQSKPGFYFAVFAMRLFISYRCQARACSSERLFSIRFRAKPSRWAFGVWDAVSPCWWALPWRVHLLVLYILGRVHVVRLHGSRWRLCLRKNMLGSMVGGPGEA